MERRSASGADTQPDRPISRKGFDAVVDFVRANPVAAVTLVGAALYVFFRIALVRFYAQFGVRPEDVGLGYAETLAQVATASAYFISIVAAGWLLLRTLQNKPVWPIDPILLGIASGLLLAIFLFSGGEQADRVRSGHPTSYLTLWDGYRNPLGIDVRCVRVVSLSNASSKLADRLHGAVLYLGKTNGIGVFYRHDTEVTLTAPINDVALETVETSGGFCGMNK